MIADDMRTHIAARLSATASEQGVKRPPPMAIGDLVGCSALPAGPRRAIEALLQEKRATPELGFRPPIAEIDAWVVGELERLHPDRLALSDAPERDMREEADRLYRRVIDIEV